MLLERRYNSKKNRNNADDLLAVPVTGDDTSSDGLEQSRHLPCSRSSLRMSNEALLRHNRDSVAGSATDRGEDVVPNAGLILLLDFAS